jgi:glucokinase
MANAIGIDVGGTKIAGGLVSEDGQILAEHTVHSPATDSDAMEEAIAELVAGLLEHGDAGSVGVGAAGYVDADRATVAFAPNLAWRDIDLKQELEQHIDLPVVVENDANAAAWGEFQHGAGRDVDDLLMLTVGTGVGGGIVKDGELYRGAFGVAAELGHLRMVPGGRLCPCGNRGCLEAYGSGSALVKIAKEEVTGGSLLGRNLVDLAGGDPEEITGPLITGAAQDGDPFAVEQLEHLGRWLGEAIAMLASVLDPAMTVIGGGVAKAGDLLMDPMRRAYAQQLPGRGHRPMQRITAATLGNKAGMIGVADLSRR